MKSSPASPMPGVGPIALLIGTRKGAFILRSDRARRTWKLSSPMFLGHIVHHLMLDPRDRRTMLMASSTGHLGPTIFRSTDAGVTWKESVT
ncbi:MAG: glycosyl hydrolase, partial [Nitrospiraceae bacterium]